MLYKEAVKAGLKGMGKGSKPAGKRSGGVKNPLLPEQYKNLRYGDGSSRRVRVANKGDLLVGTGAHGDTFSSKGPKRIIDIGASAKRLAGVPARAAGNIEKGVDNMLSRTGSVLKDMLIDIGSGIAHKVDSIYKALPWYGIKKR